MKIRALKSFEGIKDNERNVFPKAGDVWEVSEERANFLKEHGVIEFVEEEKEDIKVNINLITELNEKEIAKKTIEYQEKAKSNKNKKHSKK